jgi:hypothetical protein
MGVVRRAHAAVGGQSCIDSLDFFLGVGEHSADLCGATDGGAGYGSRGKAEL